MKKLLLLLLLIPGLLYAQTQEEKRAKEKARKEAVKELKAVLKKYPHWKWDGKVEEDAVAATYSVTILTDSDIRLGFSFFVKEKNGAKEKMGTSIFTQFPKYTNVAWTGKPEGWKVIEISARADSSPSFTVKLYSENSPYTFFFMPKDIVTADDGSKIDPMKSIFESNKFSFKYLSSYFSVQDGEAYQISLETSGVREIQKAALDLLLL